MIATITLALWAARPWGGNYAYQEISGYLLLAGLTAWAIAPQLFVFLLAGYRASQLISLVRVATAGLICLVGAALVLNALFIHPDPQSGLVFLFLPFFQWAIVVAVELVLLCVPRRLDGATSEGAGVGGRRP